MSLLYFIALYFIHAKAFMLKMDKLVVLKIPLQFSLASLSEVIFTVVYNYYGYNTEAF